MRLASRHRLKLGCISGHYLETEPVDAVLRERRKSQSAKGPSAAPRASYDKARAHFELLRRRCSHRAPTAAINRLLVPVEWVRRFARACIEMGEVGRLGLAVLDGGRVVK